MKHVVVRPPADGQSRLNKGLVIEDGQSLEELKIKLRDVFDCEVDAVGVVSKCDGQVVEVADVKFIRDDDSLCILNHHDLASSNKSDVDVDSFPKSSTLGDEDDGDFVRLNVGGQQFLTCRSTLLLKAPSSMLARMLASEATGLMSAGKRDSNGAIVLDRCPMYFRHVLNFVRTGKVILDEGVNPEGVYEEAKYFGVDEMLSPLSEMMESPPWSINASPKMRPLCRRDVISALLATPTDRELRFQGVDMRGADLSKLDLRRINFKYANLRGCNLSGANLSWSCLERADLSNANLDGAQLLGVKMLCANLESATLRGCNLDDPGGANANMEGVNLRGACAEGSNMARVNMRVASVKRGNLRNCDLRAAVLAGADLEFCDLSGSDLGEANLRGANLKDTTLELMQTPLHMSQTIR